MRVQPGHIQENEAQGVCGPQSGTCAVLCLILSKRGILGDCGAEPLPVAETGEAEQAQRSNFHKGAPSPAGKIG